MFINRDVTKKLKRDVTYLFSQKNRDVTKVDFIEHIVDTFPLTGALFRRPAWH